MPNDIYAEKIPPPSLDQVVRTLCQGITRDRRPCGKPATEAIVEAGDYVPVCAYHANIARFVGWSVGRLRPNTVLTDKNVVLSEKQKGS